MNGNIPLIRDFFIGIWLSQNKDGPQNSRTLTKRDSISKYEKHPIEFDEKF